MVIENVIISIFGFLLVAVMVIVWILTPDTPEEKEMFKEMEIRARQKNAEDFTRKVQQND